MNYEFVNTEGRFQESKSAQGTKEIEIVYVDDSMSLWYEIDEN